jgi:hypothetical protein
MCESLLEAFPQLRSSLVSGRREAWQSGIFHSFFLSIVREVQETGYYLSA